MEKMHFRNNQIGMSLISVMIAVGITGILVVSIMRMLSNAFTGSAKVTLDTDRDALKNMLQTAISCQHTFTNGYCTSGSLLALKREHKDGTISTIATNTGAGTKFGRITLRAECNGTGDGIIVKSALLSATGNLTSTQSSNFLPEPLTGKIRTWSDTQSLLFLPGVELCSSSQALLTQNGYQQLPSGLILQWFTGPNFKSREVSVATYVNFPKPFPPRHIERTSHRFHAKRYQ